MQEYQCPTGRAYIAKTSICAHRGNEHGLTRLTTEPLLMPRGRTSMVFFPFSTSMGNLSDSCDMSYMSDVSEQEAHIRNRVRLIRKKKDLEGPYRCILICVYVCISYVYENYPSIKKYIICEYCYAPTAKSSPWPAPCCSRGRRCGNARRRSSACAPRSCRACAR